MKIPAILSNVFKYESNTPAEKEKFWPTLKELQEYHVLVTVFLKKNINKTAAMEMGI